MTEIDAGLVRRKIGLIVQNLDALAEIDGIPLERYIADRFRLKEPSASCRRRSRPPSM